MITNQNKCVNVKGKNNNNNKSTGFPSFLRVRNDFLSKGVLRVGKGSTLQVVKQRM